MHLISLLKKTYYFYLPDDSVLMSQILETNSLDVERSTREYKCYFASVLNKGVYSI